MKKNTWITESAEQTRSFGEKIGLHAQPDMVFLLEGDLGAGKTTLTQGIAKGLGIDRPVKSPTFNILKIYQGRFPLYHIDAYRLEGISQDLGFDELIEDGGLMVIEWSRYVPELVPDQHMIIRLSLADQEDQRLIECVPNGERYERFLEDLSK